MYSKFAPLRPRHLIKPYIFSKRQLREIWKMIERNKIAIWNERRYFREYNYPRTRNYNHIIIKRFIVYGDYKNYYQWNVSYVLMGNMRGIFFPFRCLIGLEFSRWNEALFVFQMIFTGPNALSIARNYFYMKKCSFDAETFFGLNVMAKLSCCP